MQLAMIFCTESGLETLFFVCLFQFRILYSSNKLFIRFSLFQHKHNYNESEFWSLGFIAVTKSRVKSAQLCPHSPSVWVKWQFPEEYHFTQTSVHCKPVLPLNVHTQVLLQIFVTKCSEGKTFFEVLRKWTKLGNKDSGHKECRIHGPRGHLTELQGKE